MLTFSYSKPSMDDIRVAQNEDRNVRRQLAKNYWYTAAKRWHLTGAVLAILLALVAPLVLLFGPDLGPTLGAVAGLWVFASRLLLEPLKQRLQQKGAAAQEMFDCDVLGLTWNLALGREPSLEEVRKASKTVNKAKTVAKHKDWYPAGTPMTWPSSVLTCQRSNAVWARRQHRGYGLFLIIAAAAWGVVGIVVAVWHGASLAEYLTTIALPSLPAMLDATELSKRHLQASTKRQTLEDECDRLLDLKAAQHTELREVQDQLFELRRDAPLVAGWFYKLVSKSYEEDMKYAAAEQAKRVP